MKLDRFAVLLAGLLLVAGLPADARKLKLGRTTISIESSAKALAAAVALQVGGVKKRFDENRRALRTVRGANGKPAYLHQEVSGLITRTGEDLDQAIQKAQPSGTEPLRAWAAEEIRRIQGELPPAGPVASLPGPFAPRAVAVVASLRGFGLPMLAKTKKPAPPKPAPPKQDTVTADTANQLLDQVAEVVSRIFVLADQNDLEVTLWVGSTPAQKAAFRFWPQGHANGSGAPQIVMTDSTKRHVLRGLYAYNATLGVGKKGALTQAIDYPLPAGAPVAQASEPLDLVKGTIFFCCRFNEDYCHHVGGEKDCR